MKNHTSKAIALIFAVMLVVSAVSGAALADVIWEPEDDFYTAHASECEYVNTQYYSNGPTGYLEIFDKPNGSGIGFADNGVLFYVSFAYAADDGDWGVIEYSRQGEKLIPADYSSDFGTGWARLPDMLPRYDSAAFSADHAAELKTFEGDASSLLTSESIVLWTYPNSGEFVDKFSPEGMDESFADGFSVSYTDEQGRQWLYCGYFQGRRNFWVCLSDPANSELPPMSTPAMEFIKPGSDELPEKTGGSLTTTVIICVCAVVIISAVLIIVLGKRRKAQQS